LFWAKARERGWGVGRYPRPKGQGKFKKKKTKKRGDPIKKQKYYRGIKAPDYPIKKGRTAGRFYR